MRTTLVRRNTRAGRPALHFPFILPNSLCLIVLWLLALGLSVGCRPLSPQKADHDQPATTPPAVAALAPAVPQVTSVASQAEVSRKLAGVALPFIANQGQYDARVKFAAPTFGGTLFVTTEGELVYALAEQGREKETSKGVVLTEALVEGNVSAVSGEGQVLTKVNVFHGSDPAQWQRQIPTYGRVSLGEVYAGIELKLAAYGKRVEKLFYVQPGADPEQIRVRLSGGHAVRVNGQGELEVETELGEVTVSRPVAYQETGDQKEFIEVAYAVEGEEYGFVVGAYDGSRELVIDPILAATFLGGSGGEGAETLALDIRGEVYVTGLTFSADFPGIGPGSADRALASVDAYVAKLDGELSTLLAATFLGGSNFENARTLALDSRGNVYVAGSTDSADFPGVGPGSADRTLADFEAFVAKLDGELSTLLAATFLGGSNFENARTLALDSRDEVYVAGFTDSADFPGVDAGSADRTLGGIEAFVAKLDGELSTIQAATFLGGSNLEDATTLALDSRGEVYVAGRTLSADFPGVDAGSADRTLGGIEAFVAKLDGELSTLLAVTFLGGSGDEDASTLALDSTGNIYVAGGTTFADFPGVGPGSADRTLVGGQEAFVAKLDSNLSAALCAGRIATIVGTAGDDILTGTSGSDVIQGLGGNDRIDGRGGNDLVCSGPGNDTLYGATEDDRLYGQTGDDALNGGLGNDRLEGAAGNDTLRGGTGNDALSGGGGTDSCDGGSHVVGDTATPDCETIVNVP